MPDQAPIINAALADPAISAFELPAGITEVASTIFVPPGKRLYGKGRAISTIKALPEFDRHVGLNGLVATVEPPEGGRGTSLHDFAIDVNKVGLDLGLDERILGLMMLRAIAFSVRRVDVYNCTGYAHFARGDPEPTGTVPSSGVYSDCQVFNAHIHFEQMACKDILLDNILAEPGDGDIPNASFFHPVTGCSNITYRHAIGRGSAGAAVELTANVRAMDNIRFEDTHVVTEVGSAFVVTPNHLFTSRLHIINSSFVSKTGLGGHLKNCDAFIHNSYFEGKAQGLALANSTSRIYDSTAYGWNDGNSSAFGVTGGTECFWTGGVITADALGTGGEIPISGATFISPATQVNPVGGGLYCSKTLPNGNGTTSATPVVIGTTSSSPWTIPVLAGRRYQIHLFGTCQVSVAGGGIKIGILGPGKVRGFLQIGTNMAALTWHAHGVAQPYSSITATPTANVDHVLQGEFSFIAASSGTMEVQFLSTLATSQALITEGSSISIIES